MPRRANAALWTGESGILTLIVLVVVAVIVSRGTWTYVRRLPGRGAALAATLTAAARLRLRHLQRNVRSRSIGTRRSRNPSVPSVLPFTKCVEEGAFSELRPVPSQSLEVRPTPLCSEPSI